MSQKYVAHFKHVLVDEFRDVNSASASLLRRDMQARNRCLWLLLTHGSLSIASGALNL